jgi:hypothetical protein
MYNELEVNEEITMDIKFSRNFPNEKRKKGEISQIKKSEKFGNFFAEIATEEKVLTG